MSAPVDTRAIDAWFANIAPTRGVRLDAAMIGARPMDRAPAILSPVVRRPSPYSGVRGGVRFGDYAAAYGRGRRWFECVACGQVFVADAAAAHHVAEEGHRVVKYEAEEIVPVDTSDDPEEWEDGEGRSARDRAAETGGQTDERGAR